MANTNADVLRVETSDATTVALKNKQLAYSTTLGQAYKMVILDSAGNRRYYSSDTGDRTQDGSLSLTSGKYLKSDYVKALSTGSGIELDDGYRQGVKAYNKEVLVGDYTSTDYSKFENDGTLKFSGAAKVWEDVRIVPGAFKFSGIADPSLISWQPGGSGTTLKVYAFNNSDGVFASVQIPHKYKEGGDIKAHIHWTPHNKGATESGHTVAWKIDYTWANIDGTFPSTTTVDLTDTCDGTDHKHQMTLDVPITGTGKKISSMIELKIYRDSSDTWSGTGSGSPVLLEMDFHFEIDTVGSRSSGTK